MKTVLHNGKIYVERDSFAQSILIENGLISKVGTSDEILLLADDETEVIDCKGKTVIPGLNDSHLHFMQMGETMYQVKIDESTSIEDMIKRCKEFLVDHEDRCINGIHAIGWNQDLFVDGDRLPDRNDLDQISTEIPIVLERVCGHIVSTNTKVIEILGLDGDSPQYQDGEFLIGEDGLPNGIFKGNACNIAKDVIPDFSLEERREILEESMKFAVSKGLTSVQSNDVGTTFMDGPAAFALFHRLYDDGKGLLRYRHQVCFNNLDGFREYLKTGERATGEYPEESWLTLGPLKLFKDGSLGARTALMKNGYADDRANHGLEWIKQDEMDEYCKLAKENNMQVITHAIGDAAIDQTIEAYKKAFVDGKNKLRHALVHCQITDNELINKIKEEEILVAVQPIFLDYDMNVVENRCGTELASTSYAFNSFYKKGVNMSFGTDCPVEECNPFPNIYEAVTRKDRSGNPPNGFYSEECVDVYTAIDAYTIGSAYMEFMEDKKGRLKEGYYADLVILDKDIFTIDPMEIKDIKPELTMVSGKIVYKA
ncbi:MAG: amidohydrolase [Anaerovoracaceae bacterium]